MKLKCDLTQNKPLRVTKGAALGGHGLCQTCRQEKQGGGGNGCVGLEYKACWLHSLDLFAKMQKKIR